MNVHEVYLSKGNSLYGTVIRGISTRNNDDIRYHKFRVYGEFEESEPDQYGVLTFNVMEWFPLDKYVAIKDTIEWDKYKIIYSVLVKCNISVLVIIIITIIVNKKTNK